jgi:hypothetical protein
MKWNKYLPFALLYFFFNSLGLPYGLTYTTLLAPLFYLYTYRARKTDVYLPFLISFTAIYLIQSYHGVDDLSYLITFLNMSGVYIFAQAVYTFFKSAAEPEKIFDWILIMNFVLCLLAIPIYFTSVSEYVWIEQYLTEGFDNFRRLKMFTYEASYYATLMIPVFFFFFLQVFLRLNRIKSVLLVPMLVLPYILSFSLGVIAGILASILITYFVNFRELTKKRTVLNIIINGSFCGMLLLMVGLVFFPENPLFVRIENIFSGIDSSGKGRTYDAFRIAAMILDQRSEFWGIGPGQIKIIGAEIIRTYYSYPPEIVGLAIPNATAETFVLFGYFGLAVRFSAQIICFIIGKVWKNYFQMLLFCFVFIYQFTGSFITNIGEYVIWILAFTRVFAAFDIPSNAPPMLRRSHPIAQH